MESSEYPRNLVWWLAFETHTRRGEICGLDVGHIKVDARMVTIRRNKVNKSVVKNTKARKPRVFSNVLMLRNSYEQVFSNSADYLETMKKLSAIES